jgi:hypothetical protein
MGFPVSHYFFGHTQSKRIRNYKIFWHFHANKKNKEIYIYIEKYIINYLILFIIIKLLLIFKNYLYYELINLGVIFPIAFWLL